MEEKTSEGVIGDHSNYNNEHISTITKCLGETWRLVVGTQIVNPGDTITWDAKNAKLLFGFPVDLEKYFELEDGQFEQVDDNRLWQRKEQEGSNDSTRIQEVDKGGYLTLKVRENNCLPDNETDPNGKIRIVYDIYVYNEEKEEYDDYVVGNSSPEMIIQRPYR